MAKGNSKFTKQTAISERFLAIARNGKTSTTDAVAIAKSKQRKTVSTPDATTLVYINGIGFKISEERAAEIRANNLAAMAARDAK